MLRRSLLSFLTFLTLSTFMLSRPSDASADQRTILFLGDSLTAGYGLEPNESYPALIEQRIRDKGWNFQVVNAGVSGDTTAGGLRRLTWLLKRPVDVLFLALGANDGLRGLDPNSTESNLREIIKGARDKYPGIKIVIAGMLVPPTMGEPYAQRFREVFRQVAETEDVTFLPFLLEGVAAETDLNLPDGIHPNAEGYKKVAGTVWAVLEPLLRQLVDEK